MINRSVIERARPASTAELAGIPWLAVLEGADLERARGAIRIAPADTGDRICRFGRAPTFWFGVVDGLLKMSNDTPSGGTITYMGVPPGAWFGEGTLIKREPYRYNIEALRRSTVAGLPIEDFHALLDRSNGTLNAMLNTGNTAWLLNHPMESIIVFNTWVGTAFSMLLFSSALASVPPTQLESARMVGAGAWAQFRDVIYPHIRGHILTNTLLITLWTFNTFTPYLLTAGGPDDRSNILPIFIYQLALNDGALGQGAAISLIMIIINLVIAMVYLRLLKERKS